MGSPIFEINFKFPNDSDSLLKNQVCKNIAKLSFDIANSKLPIKTKIIEIKKKVNIN